MTVQSLLRLLVEVLEDLDVPYMLTGSLASSFHGLPRATQDIDVVVDADLRRLHGLAERLRGAGLYVSDVAVSEAVETRGLFNAVDVSSGSKIDFIMLKERAFSREEFGRRSEEELVGLTLHVVQPEDIVIAKLEWAGLGESERQLSDVAGILAVQGHSLDRARIERWVDELGLGDEWARVLEIERAQREST